ncbi:MAG: TolB family protein, partial [Gemmatimonadota bacterium]
PDGRWLAFDSNRDGSQHIFRMPLGGGPVQRLTEGTWDDFLPRFSPDGRRIGFHSYRFGERKLFSVAPDGGAVEQISDWPGHHLQMDWARNSDAIVYERRLNGSNSVRLLRQREGHWIDSVQLAEVSRSPAAAYPRVSPDGRFVSFLDNGAVSAVLMADGSIRRVFARPDASATLAAWAPRGQSLYVVAIDSVTSALWVAPLTGAPRQLFRFEDPSRQPTRYGLVAREDAVYLTMGERRADIAVVALEPE